MRADEVRQRYTTPLTAPAYAPAIPRFTNREYLNIYYRTDFEAARAVTPEPLVVEDPIVRFELMNMGDVTAYGPYVEAGQAVAVSFDGERGEYLTAMYVDNFPAIAIGREINAYPKVLGTPRLYVDQAALVGTLDYGSLRVATATMGYKHHALDPDEARASVTVPTYAVKYVVGYDATKRVCELTRTQIEDVTVIEAWTGPARLQLFEHVLAPLADLPVREIVSATHIVTDLSLGPVRPVHDYLAPDG
ncbi:acetoacetate decarboxylase [Micromonospora sp. NPDC004704]